MTGRFSILLVLLAMALPMRASVDDLTRWMHWMESSSPDGRWSLIRMEAQSLQKANDTVPPANLVYFLKEAQSAKTLWAGTEYQDGSGGTPPLFCWNPDSSSCVVVDRLGRGDVKILALSIGKEVTAVSFDPEKEICRLEKEAMEEKGAEARVHSLTIVFYDKDFQWVDADHCEGSIEAGKSDAHWRLKYRISMKPVPTMTLISSARL